MKTVRRIARKEFAGFFSSPAAFIFLGTFLAVTLFIFFWVERFFARNIADVRPLFEWMPVLLIFLSAAITMRMWSEERRAGTLEFLLTSPVPPWKLVAGKFVACLGLVGTALVLTLPLPVTVSFLGPLDWGPVFGGYLATVILAGAYIAIGLFASAGSSNQIVSLIGAVLLGGFFYGLGAEWVTSLFGGNAGEVMSLLGSGTRFEAIARGMLDIRDLFYFVSITGAFLSLNVLVLERLRWAGNPSNSAHRRWLLATLLFAANFLAANLWLSSFDAARADVTEGKIYSISDSTRGYLSRLREPLLIRGYFSAKTHPLLAPLAPRLRDLLEEYAIAGEGKVRLEFVDPREDSELEREAGEKYGIRPVPFQFASKYEASVVNSYFDILVQYGDQHEVLGFQDFIEVKVESEREIEVELRNPEYDITRAIKKVLYAYQGAGKLFENIPSPVTFRGYFSPDEKLPQALVDLKRDLEALLAEREGASEGKLAFEFADPDDAGGDLGRKLTAEYGFRPMAAGLFSSDTFWFYMVLEGDGELVQIPLPAELDKGSLERSFDAALKRFSRGFLKTVTMVTPPPPQQPHQGFGMPPPQGKNYSWLREQLSEEYSVRSADLSNGSVPAETDVLLLLSPTNLDEKQLFAVDQFLMRGGTVIAATSPFDVGLQGFLSGKPHESGLDDWLKHHGITVASTMVLDPRNAAFPVPVQRRVGGFVVHETQLINYP
jgi:ABC-2 type transport system permease protein